MEATIKISKEEVKTLILSHLKDRICIPNMRIVSASMRDYNWEMTIELTDEPEATFPIVPPPDKEE